MASADVITQALQRIPYGLYVVGSLHDGVPATMIANWVSQVSFHPPCVAIAVEHDSKMRGYVESSGFFCVNILPAGSTETAKAFLKSPEATGGKIGGREFVSALHGTPFLKDAGAAFECRVTTTHVTGDHLLIIGEVMDAVVRSEGDAVLTLRETGWRYRK